MSTLDPRLVGRISGRLARRQPRVTNSEARDTVARLRESAGQAPSIVAHVSGLDGASATARVPVRVVDRTRWAEAAAETFNSMLDVAHSGNAVQHSLVDSATNIVTSAGMGAGLSVMAANVLGQHDPFSPPDGRLILVAPNIVAFGRAYDLVPGDLALWVCVHELTHAAQFAQAPWLRDYVISRVTPLLNATDSSDFSLEEGPGGELTALMSLLEGHAEYVMNDVSRQMIPSLTKLKGAMTTRRAETNPLKTLVYKLTGMDLKMAQYATGNAFVRGVIAEAGTEGFNQIWADPLNAPSLAELSAPLSWVHRVL
ncbi:MAG: zinc-dependent metalloprotease [Ancrocorticia sp.]|uniref:zinc-dependent metalloprotease n=2 Tax=Ancrocorticia sp. TaxID=2593684 RepID=UPI003F910346